MYIPWANRINDFGIKYFYANKTEWIVTSNPFIITNTLPSKSLNKVVYVDSDRTNTIVQINESHASYSVIVI